MTVTKPVTKPRRCKACGTRISQPTTGRPREFCDDACRQRAHRRRAARPVWHSRQSDEWATPRDRFAEWDQEFGPFTLDAAATADNALCENFYTAADDGLTQPWSGTVWVNPPYSTVARWIAKGYQAAQDGATVVLLVPARTDTRWWHEWAVKGDVRFLKGRLRFGDATSGAPFPSALVVFEPPGRCAS